MWKEFRNVLVSNVVSLNLISYFEFRKCASVKNYLKNWDKNVLQKISLVIGALKVSEVPGKGLDKILWQNKKKAMDDLVNIQIKQTE